MSNIEQAPTSVALPQGDYPLIAARITSELESAGLSTYLYSITEDTMWGTSVHLVSTHHGGRGFPVSFSYYPRSDTWANGCGNIDPDQEAAIAIVRAVLGAGSES